MAETTQQPANKTAKPLSEDDHIHALTTVSPLMNGMAFVIFSVSWVIFFLLQITSTKEAVLGLLLGGIQVSPSTTAPELLQFAQGTLERNQMIANAIAWGFQLFLLLIAFPSDRAFAMVHKKYNLGGKTPASIANKTRTLAKWKKFTLVVLMIADVATDFLYASSGHALISGFSFLVIPNISSPGGFLVSALFTVVSNGVNIFIGSEALHRLEACIDEWARRKDA